MINLDTIPDASNRYKLEYFNTLGLIFKNQIYLNRNDELMQFDFCDIKRIFLKKERAFKGAFVWFALAMVLFIASYFLGTALRNYKLLGFFISGALMLYSILKKSYEYKLVLVTANCNMTSILINSTCKQQATELVSLTKRKIKDNAQYLKAS